MFYILIENQLFRIKWTKANYDWYTNKGYPFTKFGDYFTVAAEDLSKGSHIKVKVQCDYCGEIVDVAWKDYYNYRYHKYACKNCKGSKVSEETQESRKEHLYVNAKQFCDDNGYILLSTIEEIQDSNSIVEYICPKHGIHKTKIYALVLKHGCAQCAYEKNSENAKLDLNYIKKRFQDYGSEILNIEQYINSTTKNLIVTCPDCNQKFITSYYSYFKHGGQRCPECSCSESGGEYIIRKWLEANNIKYIQQFRFPDCKYVNTLPFDFYIYEKNILIEYDGEQHYFPIKRSQEMSQEQAEEIFKKVQIRDSIKTEYCKNKGLFLLRIPYWQKDDIDQILHSNILT